MIVREVSRKILLPIAVVLVVGVSLLSYYHREPIPEPVAPDIKIKQDAFVSDQIPDFARYKNVQQKKRAFFAFLRPMVERENQRLLNNRARLSVLLAQLNQGASIAEPDLQWLNALAKRYRINPKRSTPEILLGKLLNRVDVVPVSLALSQSANESAWGTSRFALQANNLFGQWCFSKGCGVVPKLRPEGESYEVARFASPQDSVAGYIHNLNTNSAYLYFREIRASLRENRLLLSGDVLAEGLMSYSARGDAYIDELREMIRVNGLARYDQG